MRCGFRLDGAAICITVGRFKENLLDKAKDA